MTIRVLLVVYLFAALSVFGQVPPEEQPLPEPPVMEAPATETPELVSSVADTRRIETLTTETSPFEITGTSTGDTVLRFLEGTTEHSRIEHIGTGNTVQPSFAGTFRLWNTVSAPMIFGIGGGERMRIHADGNVAIGANYNVARLGVFGSVIGGKALVAQQSTTISSTPASPQHDVGLQVYSLSNVTTGVTTNGSVVGSYLHGYNSGAGTQPASFGLRLFSGNLPYANPAVTGTVTSAYGAHVQIMKANGTVTNGYGFYVANVEADTDYAFYQAGTDDDNYFAGGVGIGTLTPANKLHVRIANGSVNAPLKLETTDVDSITGLSLKNDAGNWHIRVDGADGDRFKIYDANVSASRLTIDTSGNVGIGTSSAGYKLHVNGTARFEGEVTGTLIRAHYQDLAEWVPATEDMTPGTVVVLNPVQSNEVMPSGRAYDTTVAGVVSAQPGVLLGEAAPTKEQIATTGRVKVRVDASRGAIAIGDLLVTSDVPGMAMKSSPVDVSGVSLHRPGTIIGKALEPLQSGTGEILVLLSLQ